MEVSGSGGCGRGCGINKYLDFPLERDSECLIRYDKI